MFEHILRKYNFCGNKAKFTHVIILTIMFPLVMIRFFLRMYAMEGSRKKSHVFIELHRTPSIILLV